MKKSVALGTAASLVDEAVGEDAPTVIDPDPGEQIGLRVYLFRRKQRDLPNEIGRGATLAGSLVAAIGPTVTPSARG